IHVAVILVLLLYLPSLPRFKPGYEEAIAASRQFLGFWYSVWFAWFALYGLLAIAEFTGTTGKELVHLILDFIGSLVTAFFLLCYVVMTVRTVPAHQFVRVAYWILAFCAIYVVAEGIATRIDEDFRAIFDGVLGLISGVVLALL